MASLLGAIGRGTVEKAALAKASDATYIILCREEDVGANIAGNAVVIAHRIPLQRMHLTRASRRSASRGQSPSTIFEARIASSCYRNDRGFFGRDSQPDRSGDSTVCQSS